MFEEALPVCGYEARAEGLGAETEVPRDAGHVLGVDAHEAIGPRTAVSTALAAKIEGEGAGSIGHAVECSAGGRGEVGRS